MGCFGIGYSGAAPRFHPSAILSHPRLAPHNLFANPFRSPARESCIFHADSERSPHTAEAALGHAEKPPTQTIKYLINQAFVLSADEFLVQ